MKRLLPFVFSISLACAVPTVSTVDWDPACDGSSIEIVTDDSKTVSVQASAFHSAKILSWTIHYLDGLPISAEFRESNRGRISEGEKAGEYSGDNPLTRLVTCTWVDGKVRLADKALAKELMEILARVSPR